MRKFLISILSIAFCFVGSAQVTVTEDVVIRWAAHYSELIKRSPDKIIQQIHMDGVVLNKLLENTQGFKLIASANPQKDTTTVFIQLWKGGRNIYYDISSIFNRTQTGMRNHAPICPPPSLCDAGSAGSLTLDGISGPAVKLMAKGYNDLVKLYPKKAIRQITMDAPLLKQLLYQTQGITLIAGVDLEDASSAVIIQFYRGTEITSYDIRDIFNSGMRGMRGNPALCPPPEGCGIP